jgi:hypothetical protein
MIEMGKGTLESPDRMRWLLIAQKGLDKEKLGSFYPALESELLVNMIRERLATQEYDLAQQLLETLLQVRNY